MDAWNGWQDTKAGGSPAEDSLMALVDILDFKGIDTVTFENYFITSIPFRDGYSDGDVYLSSGTLSNVSESDLTTSKLFFVLTIDNDANTVERMVVTMIPDRQFFESHTESEISYLHKRDFSGVIFYSALDGTLVDILRYGDFPITDMEPTLPSETEVQESECLSLKVPGKKKESMTKAMQTTGVVYDSGLHTGMKPRNDVLNDRSETDSYGGESDSVMSLARKIQKEYSDFGLNLQLIIDAIHYLIAETLDAATIPAEYTRYVIVGGLTDRGKVTTNGGGDDLLYHANNSQTHASNAKKNQKDQRKEKDDKPEKQYYTVTVSSSEGGFVSGGGRYQKGERVIVEAQPGRGYYFDRWIGDSNSSKPYLDIKVTRNMHFTACFRQAGEQKRPCYNKDMGGNNPLSGNMSLATTDAEGNNIINATYGMTRKGGTKFHNGVDLAGAVGTPVYAMYSGDVGRVVRNQPVRVKNAEDKWVYPDGYSGDIDAAGNRVYITSEIDGHSVELGYWHLESVAIPEGTTYVSAGQLIGYIGITGNAVESPNPHLHLNCSVDGQKADPAPYLNGDISTDDVEIKNIKCEDNN